MVETHTTVIIPCAPHHTDVLPRALGSLAAQTVPCKALYMIDGRKRGPGALRNQLLEQVNTPYVVFLDADDWIAPTFIEACERAIRPKRYVYTDWWQDEKYVDSPRYPWCEGDWHPITGLLWTADALLVRGFDPRLPSAEDTDFWLKILQQQICGIHLAQGLFHYGKEGRRSREAIADGSLWEWRNKLLRRYPRIMACCGDKDGFDQSIPVGERQPNDVLAQALWGGNHVEHGRASGRHYPRLSYPKVTWVDPRDVERNPNLWRIVDEQPVLDTPTPLGIQDMGRVFGGRQPQTVEPPPPPLPMEPPAFTPDVVHVVEIAKERLSK
jgi:hypothetical protein